MAQPKPTQVLISGNVITTKFTSCIGDIYIYRKDDADGRSARAGRHANYGYSGYYLASIFDGLDWRKLQLNKLITYEDRSYQQAQECQRVVFNIHTIISAWQGLVAVYDGETRSFRLPHLEIPDA